MRCSCSTADHCRRVDTPILPRVSSNSRTSAGSDPSRPSCLRNLVVPTAIAQTPRWYRQEVPQAIQSRKHRGVGRHFGLEGSLPTSHRPLWDMVEGHRRSNFPGQGRRCPSRRGAGSKRVGLRWSRTMDARGQSEESRSAGIESISEYCSCWDGGRERWECSGGMMERRPGGGSYFLTMRTVQMHRLRQRCSRAVRTPSTSLDPVPTPLSSDVVASTKAYSRRGGQSLTSTRRRCRSRTTREWTRCVVQATPPGSFGSILTRDSGVRLQTGSARRDASVAANLSSSAWSMSIRMIRALRGR